MSYRLILSTVALLSLGVAGCSYEEHDHHEHRRPRLERHDPHHAHHCHPGCHHHAPVGRRYERYPRHAPIGRYGYGW